jgi:hypothetical protein
VYRDFGEADAATETAATTATAARATARVLR